MQKKARSEALIRLAARIMKAWKTEDELKFPGVRFDNGDPEWRSGYGVPIDNDVPDFVKKDNDGWDFIQQQKSE